MSTNTLKSRRQKRGGRRIQQQHKQKSSVVTTKQLYGSKLSPPDNPPDVQFMPWNRTTLVSLGSPSSGSETFMVKDFCGKLRSQCDPTKRGFNQVASGDGRFIVQFKIHSVMVWNLSGYMVALAVDDFSDVVEAKGDRDQLFAGVDTGTPNHVPRIGYHLPAAHQSLVLRSDDVEGASVIYTVQGAANDKLLIYTDVSWRFDGPPKIFKQENLMLRVVKAVNITNTHLTRIAEDTEQIRDNQPSTANEIIKDVSKAASYVIPIAGADDMFSARFDMLER